MTVSKLKVGYEDGRFVLLKLPNQYKNVPIEELRTQLLSLSKRNLAFPKATLFDVVEVELEQTETTADPTQ